MDEIEIELLMEEAQAFADAEDEANRAAQEAEWDEITRAFLDLDSAGHKDHWFWE